LVDGDLVVVLFGYCLLVCSCLFMCLWCLVDWCLRWVPAALGLVNWFDYLIVLMFLDCGVFNSVA